MISRHNAHRRSIWRNIKGLAVLVLLAPIALSACSDPQIEIDDSAPSPALWRVENPDGELEGWLFGTIHSLPDGVEWRTAILENSINESEWLVLEIGELDGSGELSRIFGELSRTPDLPVLKDRVDQSLDTKVVRAMSKAGFNIGDFKNTETWAAALTLAQANSFGKSQNGVDHALFNRFENRLILEGAREQLSIFDGLPEEDQIDLLTAVIQDSDTDAKAEYRKLVEMWLFGDMDRLAAENTKGILADPELRAALLINRNEDWVRKIDAWMPEKGPMLIAVGAAHLAGEDGLPALLRDEGYVVRRIQ